MINSKTFLYGVFGRPVSHSLSPVMHTTAFKYIGHNGVYLAFEISDIEAGVSAIRALNMQGVSVTIPHKISIMPFLDDLDDLAQKIGAVNTVVNSEGRLKGYNSDGLGAVAALEEKTSITGKNIAIIGAGGAARAIGFAVQQKGGRVIIVNRSPEKGRALADALNTEFCPLSDFKNICDILINTTPLGMTPHTDVMPVSSDIIMQNQIIMDIVYNPLETCLLKAAKAKGCTIVDGAAMFVYQGAIQFEMWTGQKAPINIMRQTVINKLTT